MTLSDLYWLIGFAAAFVLLERLAPRRHGQKTLRPGWKTDVMHLLVGGQVIHIGMMVVVVTLSFLAIHAVPDGVAAIIRAQPGWLQFVEILILSDLAVYAVHRLSHAVPVLWRFHAVHHSSQHLDWMAAHRVHPVEQILFSGAAAAPAFLLGFDPLPMMIYALVYRGHALLLHANVAFAIGPLRHVIGSPHFHHWHHADQPEAYDRNFAAQLSIIDHVFGTFRLPEQRAPDRYGVADPVPADFLGQLTYPFRPSPATQRDEASAAAPQLRP